MKTPFVISSQTLAVLTLASILSACGGGGSSSPAPTTAQAITCPAGQVPDATGKSCLLPFTQSTIDNAQYQFNGDNLAKVAFDDLQSARTQCGFGSLKQSALLDKAAKAHATYLVNSFSAGHSESAGVPGFTGATITDRLVAAGYSSMSASEGITQFMGAPTAETAFTKGQTGTKNLLIAPYHALNMLRGFRDVGIGITFDQVNIDGKSYDMGTLVFDYATPKATNSQLFSSTDVQTYPCEGVTGTRSALYGESPSVIPTRDYQKFPSGQPVYVMVREGQALAVTSATVKNQASGQTVPLQQTLTSANDVQHLVRVNEAVIIPDVPLEPGMSYVVEIIGTNSGQSFAKTFTFKTSN
jgi:uncharacterized protein YkwD